MFLKLIRTIERYDINGKAAFATYIITIAKNTFYRLYKKNKPIPADIPETDSGFNVENAVLNGMQYAEIF